eukprot:1786157-Amphidinium_carterae.1
MQILPERRISCVCVCVRMSSGFQSSLRSSAASNPQTSAHLLRLQHELITHKLLDHKCKSPASSSDDNAACQCLGVPGLTKPTTKPPPGFPPGTAVPKGFDIIGSGRMIHQPALLSNHMLLAQSEAAKLAMESLPMTAAAQQASAIISRQKCWFCGKEDQPDQPLQICWHENQNKGVKCGKRFCFNSQKKCGSRVAFNIKPPSRSGLKDFPDCLWRKSHESIILPVVKYKHRIGARED